MCSYIKQKKLWGMRRFLAGSTIHLTELLTQKSSNIYKKAKEVIDHKCTSKVIGKKWP